MKVSPFRLAVCMHLHLTLIPSVTFPQWKSSSKGVTWSVYEQVVLVAAGKHCIGGHVLDRVGRKVVWFPSEGSGVPGLFDV